MNTNLPNRASDSQSTQSSPGKVQSIGSLVSQLSSRRGYAQRAATEQFNAVISATVGRDLADDVVVGKLNRGVLRVFASDSETVQELTFQKRAILKRIESEMPTASVRDLRFSVLTKSSE